MKWALLLCACSDVIVVQTTTTRADLTADDVRSLELWVLEQTGRDGTPVSCDDLVQRKASPRDENVIAIAEPVRADFTATLELKNLPRGANNRVVYVDLFDAPEALGSRVGAGCAASVSITGGKRTAIEVVVKDSSN